MIKNASNIPLNEMPQGSVPNMEQTLLNWFQKMVFTTITKTIVNFKVVETSVDTAFLGVWQPFTAQQLTLKPEGQREWKWFTCHAQTTLVLKPDEVITYKGTQYRVKSKLDYIEYGYFEYHLIEDYTGSGPNP